MSYGIATSTNDIPLTVLLEINGFARVCIAAIVKERVNYREFGDRNGAPLFFFHGWPGSALQGEMMHDVARELGFRVIAPDRPGIGTSPMFADRKLADWPAQLATLADSLGIGRFAILGVSGGGPYALAAAWGLRERIIGAHIVCGAPQVAELAGTGRLHPSYRFLIWLYRNHPQAVRALFAAARPFMFWAEASRFLPPLRILLPRPDAEALADPAYFDVIFRCQRDAFANLDGLFTDASIYAEPWGFRPEEIRVPVHFWHGLEDANFHHSLAADLAERIPGARLTLVENEGHFSLPIRRVRELLAAIVEPR